MDNRNKEILEIVAISAILLAAIGLFSVMFVAIVNEFIAPYFAPFH